MVKQLNKSVKTQVAETQQLNHKNKICEDIKDKKPKKGQQKGTKRTVQNKKKKKNLSPSKGRQSEERKKDPTHEATERVEENLAQMNQSESQGAKLQENADVNVEIVDDYKEPSKVTSQVQQLSQENQEDGDGDQIMHQADQSPVQKNSKKFPKKTCQNLKIFDKLPISRRPQTPFEGNQEFFQAVLAIASVNKPIDNLALFEDVYRIDMVMFAEYIKQVIEKKHPGQSQDYCIQTSALTSNDIAFLLTVFHKCFPTGEKRKKQNLQKALQQNIECKVNPAFIEQTETEQSQQAYDPPMADQSSSQRNNLPQSPDQLSKSSKGASQIPASPPAKPVFVKEEYDPSIIDKKKLFESNVLCPRNHPQREDPVYATQFKYVMLPDEVKNVAEKEEKRLEKKIEDLLKRMKEYSQ